MPPGPTFDNSYACLPERFFARVLPARWPEPQLIELNTKLAGTLQIDPDWLSGGEGVAFLSGQAIAEGSDPIATAYAGHQFGNFVPQLGDGRAILLGEVLDRVGRRLDIQLKGAGRTPFSRGGDGRAAVGPVLREYIVSEFMAAVGIPTTRGLAAVATGEAVFRDRMLPGALLVRVASSHIRVGTFQYFAARQDGEALKALADYVIARHYPQAASASQPYRALLDGVIAAQAKLIARWLSVGFIHGVMNTDNMSVAGETIDYGPCAFMDTYDPATVYSSIDRLGRYAYANQPGIAVWNLTRLAETLLPLLHTDMEQSIAAAEEALAAFEPQFTQAHHAAVMSKLGIAAVYDSDAAFASELFTDLARNQVDFTLFFRRLAAAIEPGVADEPLRSLFVDPTAADALLARWRARLAAEPETPPVRRARMIRTNPAYIPRNHRIEAVIAAATTEGDFGPFHELVSVLSQPFDDQPDYAGYAEPPLEHERVLATFCGT
ncbi:YdiU family protein [Novosphingobium resinovorum]|uniref:protein adenylyltransferase SelO n=1 Tax=Novosphingobium TaxID=165696 RepID=UPI001B3C8AF6|nr:MULTISPECIES: YdiU family protein [Novosphingobium]MBF7013874.1 YdiU family protein [Novosphingobium sp. HR1a]WJM26021.1 YdiU family protein [Novosphingobium resinovorum]